jgi:hypothetical protein|tara:strand:+ start:121 stop:366 length:246 start_codon:yes stop_codon:yes gene_type:complete
MNPRLTEAKYVRDYILHLRFSDGTEGDVDLSQELEGEIFEPLKERAFFKTFTVSPGLHTVTWPNGADFAPEFLYQKVQISA